MSKVGTTPTSGTDQAAQKTPGGGILRFGSLSVKVKKTTEAFNNYFGERKHSWGSSSSSHHSLDGMMTNAGSVNSLNLVSGAEY